MLTVMTKNSVGDSIGIVILLNLYKYPAPSISALSYKDESMDCKPPNKTKNVKPTFIQIVVAETDSSAHFGSVSHPIASIPNRPSISLSNPIVGLNKYSQNTEAAATDTPIVEEKIVRKKPIPFSFSFAIIARNKLMITVVGTVYKTNKNVDFMLFKNIGELNIFT